MRIGYRFPRPTKTCQGMSTNYSYKVYGIWADVAREWLGSFPSIRNGCISHHICTSHRMGTFDCFPLNRDTVDSCPTKYQELLMTIPLLTWCCCIQLFVWEINVDLRYTTTYNVELITNKLPTMFLRMGAVNGGAIMAFFIATTIKCSTAKLNLLDKCLRPYTCQIIITLQMPAHVPNYRIDANTRARTNSPYKHIHSCPGKITIWAHDRILSDRGKIGIPIYAMK